MVSGCPKAVCVARSCRKGSDDKAANIKAVSFRVQSEKGKAVVFFSFGSFLLAREKVSTALPIWEVGSVVGCNACHYRSGECTCTARMAGREG